MHRAAAYLRNHSIRIVPSAAVDPLPDQVRIRVGYGGICGTDLHIYHGKMDARVGESRILGHEISGVVAAVGAEVADLQPGDAVTVMPLDWCGACPACRAGCTHVCQKLKFIGIDAPGGFQDLWTVPARTVLKLPPGLSLKHGALLEPLAVACHDCRLGGVRPDQLVVVLGGGPIGALIALTARAAGARVIVSEIHPFRLGLLRHLGLEAVNPHTSDLPALVLERSSGAGADVVFEVTAHPSGIAMATRLPRVRGRIVVVGIFAEPPPVNLHAVFWRELQITGARVYEREDFQGAIDLAAGGTLPLDALISAVVPLEQAEAGFQRMDGGGDVMKVLIEVNPA